MTRKLGEPEGKDWLFPPGTLLSLSPMHIHQNESVFPNAIKLDPYSWIRGTEGEWMKLDKYTVLFVKETISFVGQK